MKQIDTIIFDLGGVLIDRLEKAGITFEESS